jgi:hypothetical protein
MDDGGNLRDTLVDQVYGQDTLQIRFEHAPDLARFGFVGTLDEAPWTRSWHWDEASRAYLRHP